MKSKHSLIVLAAFLLVFTSCKNTKDTKTVETKNKVESTTVSNKDAVTVQNFIGNNNTVYKIVFNTNAEVPTALVETETFKKTLSQTQAWAKGGEYTADNISLIVKEDKAILTIDNEEIELKGQ